MTPQPEIAAELQDLFVEHLSEDYETLKKCGLVSKRWNLHSRKLYFRNFDAVISVRMKAHTTDSEDFVKLVESRYSTMAACIQSLIIQGPEPAEDPFSPWNTYFQEEYSTLDLFLHRLAHHLTGLNKLTLRGIMWNRLLENTKCALASFSLKEVVWEEITVQDLITGCNALLTIIHKSGLERLRLCNIEAIDELTKLEASSAPNMDALSALSSLHVAPDSFSEPLLIAMLRMPPRIHTLCFEVTETYQFSLLSDLLRHLGNQLRSLTLSGKIIKYSFFGAIPSLRTHLPISLEKNKSLRTLSFGGIMGIDFFFAQRENRPLTVDPLLALLDTVESAGFMELGIRIVGFPLMPINLSSLQTVDKILAKRGTPEPNFRLSLERPGGHYGQPIILEKFLEMPLVQCFPSLYEQRRLILEVNGQDEVLFSPPESLKVPEVLVDSGMICTDWPGPSTTNMPLPESEDDL